MNKAAVEGAELTTKFADHTETDLRDKYKHTSEAEGSVTYPAKEHGLKSKSEHMTMLTKKRTNL